MDALAELKKIVDDSDINDFERKQAIVEIIRLKPEAEYVLDVLLPKVRELQSGPMKIRIWAIALEEKLGRQYRKDWRKESVNLQ